MGFRFAVRGIEFSGGSSVELSPSGVTLLVGSNNVGKSACLTELAMRIGARQDYHATFVVTKSITEVRDGTPEEVQAWVASSFEHRVPPGGGSESLEGVGLKFTFGQTLLDYLKKTWPEHGNKALGQAMASHLDTATRLVEANSTQSYDAIESRPSQPLHALYADVQLEQEVSANFRRAFNMDLVVDRLGAKQIALRCGKRPDARALGGELSFDYGRAARALPLLDRQGDGMRSYVACLLQTDVLRRPVVLIDEPEAFLHPPQARLLAQHLAAKAKSGGRQVIVATHSSEVVRGALDGGGADVCVVRLSREPDGENVAHVLDAPTVRSLWEDPLLRASNLLDALFHRHLVLCESDGDCRFYNAVLEALADDAKLPRPDVMFAHTGGKHRLPVAVSAVTALGVPVSVIADIDVLSAEQPLRAIWEGLGEPWSAISHLQSRLSAAVATTAKKPGREYVRERMIEVFDATTDSTLDEATVDRLRAIFRSEGGWAGVKRGGLDAMPKGDARRYADELLARLAAKGLHVVPVGELEGFLPRIGRHGPAWVVEALQVDLAQSPDTHRAREFIRGLNLFGDTLRASSAT
jgi:hypothetical protein